MERRKKLVAEVLAALLLTGGYCTGSVAYAGDSISGMYPSENNIVTNGAQVHGNVRSFLQDMKGVPTGTPVQLEAGGNLINGGTDSPNNKVTINSAGYGFYMVTGGIGANVSGNEVNIQAGHFDNDNGTIEGRALVSGGSGALKADDTRTAASQNNKLTILDGRFTNAIIAGGDIDQKVVGSVTGNTLTISGGSFEQQSLVHGGITYNGSASANIVIVNGGKFERETVVTGGSTPSGSVSGNMVTINGGTFSDSTLLYGGFTQSGAADTNSITIAGGDLVENNIIISGYGTTRARGNVLNISSGTLGDNFSAVAGSSGDGEVSGNTLTVTGGEFKGQTSLTAGSSSGTGAVLANVVTVKDGDFQGSGDIYGGRSINGELSRNSVTMDGISLQDVNVWGGYSDSGKVSNNQITVLSGTLKDLSLVGGYSKSGEAIGNTVTVTQGNFTDVNIAGGVSDNTALSGNKVVLNAGSFNGGYATGAITLSGDVSNNEVRINGGEFKQFTIAGGTSMNGGSSSGNIITLAAEDGGNVFQGDVMLRDAETLNVFGKNYTVLGVNNIKNYNFYIPRTAASGDTMLAVEHTTADTFANTKINGGVQPGSHLVKGDKVTLLEAKDGNAISDSATVPEKASLTEGVSRRYDLGLAKDGNKVVATVNNVATKDQTKSLVETRMATMTLINQGSDMLASTGFQQAAAAAEGSRGFEPFFAVSGGKLKADTGSHVDTKGIGMNLGFAKKIDNGAGSLLIGPVVEYGRGSYDSYIDDGIHGSGDSHYWGVGLMAKQTNDNGFYYEGSIRAGKSKADYSTDDMNEHTTHVSYDTEGTYWAAHLGLGKVQEISDKNSLDYYAKYFYSHQASDNVHLSTGEDYRFDSVNSSRIRLGARYLHDFGTANRFYGGLAYQYEFSSSAKAHYDGDSTPSPDVKGSSGLAEVGVILKRDKESPLSVDVGVNGWVGKMKGVTFGVKLGYSF